MLAKGGDQPTSFCEIIPTKCQKCLHKQPVACCIIKILYSLEHFAGSKMNTVKTRSYSTVNSHALLGYWR